MGGGGGRRALDGPREAIVLTCVTWVGEVVKARPRWLVRAMAQLRGGWDGQDGLFGHLAKPPGVGGAVPQIVIKLPTKIRCRNRIASPPPVCGRAVRQGKGVGGIQLYNDTWRVGMLRVEAGCQT